MSAERIAKLEADLARMQRELSELRGDAPEPVQPDEPIGDAAHLFPGTWRKTWRARGNSGSEDFSVEGSALTLSSTTVGVLTTWKLELLSDDGESVRLRQTHEDPRKHYFPDCEITVKRTEFGFEGAEVARGKTIAVRYEPVAG